MANTFEHLYRPVSQSLAVRLNKIPIVLRNHNATNNGLISPGPWRGVFFTFPGQYYHLIGTADYLSIMALHELRHVAQYTLSQQGFNRWAYWIGGEITWSQLTMLNIPAWFLEGDAVGIETALSGRGRGRMPYFVLPYKVNLLERGGFSYGKQCCRSLRHAVADHYVLGYLFTTYLRRKYGASVIGDIVRKTTHPYLFKTAVKKATGKSISQLYAAMNQELQTLWQAQLQGLKITPVQYVNKRRHTEDASYAYPQIVPGQGVIALKSGLDTATQWVRLSEDGHEQKLSIPGLPGEETHFSVAHNQLVWTEEVPAPWGRYNALTEKQEEESASVYQVIKRYDMERKRVKTLTHQSRYGTAALSPDGTQIVAVESNEAYDHQVVVLNAEDGQVMWRLPNPSNDFYRTPTWSEDGQHIVAVKIVGQTLTLVLINARTGATQDVLPYATEHLGCPVMHGRYIFYSSAYSGIDNIYALDLKTKQRYQVTSRKYGAYNPVVTPDGRWLVFNDFSKDGMDVVKMPIVPPQWTPLEEVEDRTVDYYTPLVSQENNSDTLDRIPHHLYPVEAYRPARHFFNLHSWPSYAGVRPTNFQELTAPNFSIDTLERKWQLTLLAADVLSTTALRGIYLHDFKRKVGAFSGELSCHESYLTVSLTGTVEKHYVEELTIKKSGAGLHLPLKFKHRQYIHHVDFETFGDVQWGMYTWFSQAYKGSWTGCSPRSARDIYPPWQQSLQVHYLHTPYGGDIAGQAFTAQMRLYFPGLAAHHSLQLHHFYRYITRSALFGSRHLYRSLPASYPHVHEKDLNTLGVDYDFPLYYPDCGIGPLFYLKQLRANLCYDFTHLSYPKKNTLSDIHRVGIKLLVNMHLLPSLKITAGALCYHNVSANTFQPGFVFQLR